MIVDEEKEKIVEWDEGEWEIKISKDKIRKIVERKLEEFQFDDDRIEIIVDMIGKEGLEECLNINLVLYMITFKKERERIIEELKAVILRKIDRIFEGVKLMKKMVEEVENLINSEQEVLKNGTISS